MLSLLQEKFIFLPKKLPENYAYEFSIPFEEFFLKAADGAQLNGLHFRAERRKGAIIYYHGNAGNLARWGRITSTFVEKGYDVIVMDYRTYGKSTGKLSEANLFADAQLFYNMAVAQYGEEELIVYGRSLGSSIATYIASQNNPRKLILETPFYNLLDVAKHRFPVLPVESLLKYHFTSNDYIKDVRCKVAIFHGTKDRIVPLKSGKKLFDAANNRKRKMYIIKEGKHNNLDEFKEFHKAVVKELKTK